MAREHAVALLPRVVIRGALALLGGSYKWKNNSLGERREGFQDLLCTVGGKTNGVSEIQNNIEVLPGIAMLAPRPK